MNAPVAIRLINRVDVLQQLLAAVVAVPEGVKLSIPQLRDALVSQTDVLAGLEMLCAAGELDRATLRPAPGDSDALDLSEAIGAIQIPASFVGASGAEITDRLTEYCNTHGVAQHRVLKHLCIASFSALRRRRRLHQNTIDKIEAFLAAPPPPGLELRKSGGPRVAVNGGITGASLAAELDAMIEQHGLSRTRVGLKIYGNRHGVEVLRQSNPRVGTVTKVRALLADPPIEELKPRDRWAARRAQREASIEPVEPVEPVPAAPKIKKNTSSSALLGEIAAFLKRSGLPESRFGRSAVNDPCFLARLRATDRVRPQTVERVRAFIADWCPPPPPTPVVEKEPRSFEEQLARVERGEVGIGPNLKFGRPDPARTLGGVTGEINL